MRTRFGVVKEVLNVKFFQNEGAQGDIGFLVAFDDGTTRWIMGQTLSDSERQGLGSMVNRNTRGNANLVFKAFEKLQQRVNLSVYYHIRHDEENEKKHFEIKQIEGKGLGVVALDHIPANSRVAIYPGYVVKDKDLPSTSRRYAMYYPMVRGQQRGAKIIDYEDRSFVITPAIDNDTLFAEFQNAIAPRINEPGPHEVPNVAFVRNVSVVPGRMEVWSTRDIAPGTELLVCYGGSYNNRTYSVFGSCQGTNDLSIWGSVPFPRTDIPGNDTQLRRSANTPLPVKLVPLTVVSFGVRAMNTNNMDNRIATLVRAAKQAAASKNAAPNNNIPSTSRVPKQAAASKNAAPNNIPSTSRVPKQAASKYAAPNNNIPSTSRAPSTKSTPYVATPPPSKSEVDAAIDAAKQVSSKEATPCSGEVFRIFMNAPYTTETMIRERIEEKRPGRSIDGDRFRAIAWMLVLKAQDARLSHEKVIEMAHKAAEDRNLPLSDAFRKALSGIKQFKQRDIQYMLGIEHAKWNCRSKTWQDILPR